MTDSTTSTVPYEDHEDHADHADHENESPQKHDDGSTQGIDHDPGELPPTSDVQTTDDAGDAGDAGDAVAGADLGAGEVAESTDDDVVRAASDPVMDDLDNLDAPVVADRPDDSSSTGVTATEGRVRANGRVGLLEREGEVAADFLERLLDIADLDGDIDVDIDGDRAAVAIVDSDEGRVPRRLVGPDGKVLEALQELTRLAVQAETGERSRLMLDVAGHRAQRRTALVEIARAAIADVQATSAKKALDDMTAFERKIVHDEVSAAGLVSESEGVEPHRHIVILPA